MVDDASEREWLGRKLENYVKTLPVHTFVLRTVNRSGLIRARLLGAKHVTVCLKKQQSEILKNNFFFSYRVK